MTYEKFIKVLRNTETNHVKALSFLDCCAVTQIPNAFFILLAEIVNVIDNHIKEFCGSNEIVALFGLQVAALSLQSDLPKKLKRIAYFASPQSHFCCMLNYLTVSEEMLQKVTSWKDYRSLIVDFTTGKIMNPEHYLYLLHCTDSPGKIYGHLDEKSLEQAWCLAHRNLVKIH